MNDLNISPPRHVERCPHGKVENSHHQPASYTVVKVSAQQWLMVETNMVLGTALMKHVSAAMYNQLLHTWSDEFVASQLHSRRRDIVAVTAVCRYVVVLLHPGEKQIMQGL